MSYFELSLLTGLALGRILGSRLWTVVHAGAFTALALLYGVAAVLLFVGTAGAIVHPKSDVWEALMRALRTRQLRRLAPVWLCMNAIIGLWLGPTLYFLLTNRSADSQMLSGFFSENPAGLGWLLFGYALVFATGVLVWSRVLARVDLLRALRVSLLAMLAVSVGLLLNHMDDQPIQLS